MCEVVIHSDKQFTKTGYPDVNNKQMWKSTMAKFSLKHYILTYLDKTSVKNQAFSSKGNEIYIKFTLRRSKYFHSYGKIQIFIIKKYYETVWAV